MYEEFMVMIFSFKMNYIVLYVNGPSWKQSPLTETMVKI